MFMQDPYIATLEWMALNTRRNNPKEIKRVTARGPGMLRQLWSALRRNGWQVNPKSEPVIRPPSVAIGR